jgi:uncharacterized protein YbcI
VYIDATAKLIGISMHSNMPQKSIGQLEAQISEAMVKFEREHMGRGPNRTHTHILDDMVIVRLEGVLTPAEMQLAKDPVGVRLLKEVRQMLVENSKDLLKCLIKQISGRDVVSMHSDISAKTGERIIVFTLKEDL